ncbi:glycosyl hydrolase 115 family protein [Butyrivibrio sp. JL13D10]|uniref:glycosyl hydrolase 115 family protein n=1 Tax=Butyrivibrio sp. JL13D10 TaxID=3236815 RepID=UPI0038B486B8
MCKFELFKDNKCASLLIENESYEGIKMIGETVADDIEAVTDVRPFIINEEYVAADGKAVVKSAEECIVIAATIGKSNILDKLSVGRRIKLDDIKGKREVYKITCVDNPFPENDAVKKALVIAGSDKRGTIYGMFRLSGMCGVSPLVYFGDVSPLKKYEIVIDIPEEIVSKEPSVEYRGFFINDEWPAFGNWATEKFGDINSKAYRKIFELLLRLNGNYMWPAMWNSSFSQDGPGLLNAELADKLGVIMGLSHHEPMCRSGVEWQRQYKNYSDDNTWSFLSNTEGITKFWEDGVNRNKAFENVITIGMRGEADSKLMPEDATLKDNIDVVKKAIKVQDELIKKNVNADIDKVPRMLAIYKEVEDYYYGDESTEGLKDWDELDNVIFLLSDDNHGHVRALPTEETRNHRGGFGMYYHFDYHGAPVSYEWVNCNRLTKTWEQMSLAYESGVRKMWIVNVGDLKLNEYPLCFFMDLAYDYDKYGEKAKNKTAEYAGLWIERQFPGATPIQKKDIAKVIEGYTRYNAQRTPETMNEDIYNPVDMMEGDKVWEDAKNILDTAERLNKELKDEALTAYRSMIYYPAAASLNIVLMCVEAGMNKELARRGCVYANHFAQSVQRRISRDICLVDEFHSFNGGKWNHMMSSAHVGFRSWDAYDWTYPTVCMVSPLHDAKPVISFRGEKIVNLGEHWQGPPAPISYGFTRPGTNEVLLDLDTRGDVGYSYEIVFDTDWLVCKETKGKVIVDDNFTDARKTVHFGIKKELIAGKTSTKATVKLSFDDGSHNEIEVIFMADSCIEETGDIIFIGAENYVKKKAAGSSDFEAIDYLGKSGKPAVKVFPSISNYDEEEIKSGNVPSISYNVYSEDGGAYDLDFHLVMTNPIVRGGRLKFGYSVNDGDIKIEYGTGEGYFTDFPCREWCEAVLDHEHIAHAKIELKKGINTISLYAGDAGAVFDKLVVYKDGVKLPKTYL